jgi:transmembrane sensor
MSDWIKIEGEDVSRIEAVAIRAADWMLAKQTAETWSDADQLALDAWLAESTSHVAAYWRLDDAWTHARRLKALRSPTRIPHEASEGQKKHSVVAITMLLAIGAVLIGSTYLGQFLRSDSKTYTTPIGGHLALTLPDGSKVILNTDTKLTLSDSGGRRFVKLQKGEAFFEIKHDNAHPFIVFVGNSRITDLGTKFLVRSNDDHVSVALMQGRARFESQFQTAAAQSTDLAPGDVVVATANSISVSKQVDRKLKNMLAWQRGLLVFDNATLAEAADELNRYNRQKIIIPDAAVGKFIIGGTFYENDIPALLNTAQQVFGLSIHKQGDEIVISR